MNKNIVAAVILDNTVRTFDKIYNYLVPDDMRMYLETGMRVFVPFGKGNTKKLAYFLDFVPYDRKLKDYELKYISEIVDDRAILTKEMFKLAKSIRDEYFCTYGQTLRTMVPLALKVSVEKLVLEEDGTLTPFQVYLKSLDNGITELNRLVKQNKVKIVEQGVKRIRKKFEKAVRLKADLSSINDLISINAIKSEKHIRVLELLQSYDDITVNDFTSFESISKTVLSTMEKKGYIEIFDKPVVEQIDIFEKSNEITPSELIPNPQQRHVTHVIANALDKNKYDKFLIHGITGSGKTEVYLNLAQKAIEQGKGVIVLVPEIALTPMMVNRFGQRFGKNLTVMHSRLSIKQRYDAWMSIKNNQVSIALGTRSCIFAPFENLGLIIIDEEHDGSYISEITPKYHTNFVADTRAKNENAVLVLGSATPKVNTYYSFSKIDRILEMTKRAAGELPEVSIVDMRDHAQQGRMSTFSKPLIDDIEENMKKGEQTVLFLNRRGYSTMQLCTSCKGIVKCTSCDVPMTYHKGRGYMMCHYCGSIQKKPDTCPYCNEKTMMDVGSGTERCELELKEKFPDATVIRMDLDTTSMKNSHKEILERFEKEKIDILIGTQMIAKGHDYPLVTLVGILNADMLGAGSSFESNEVAYQLLTQSAGRAGRADLSGRAVIQTYNVDSPLMEHAIKQDYPSFYNRELAIRKVLEMPPYTNMAFLTFSSIHSHIAQQYANKAYNALKKTKLTVFTPSIPQISKLNDNYRYKVTIKHDNATYLNENLTKLNLLLMKKMPKTVNMSIEAFKDEFGIF